MSIRTPGVERYLEKDPELLFRHYMLSKEYPKVRFCSHRCCWICGHRGTSRSLGMYLVDRWDVILYVAHGSSPSWCCCCWYCVVLLCGMLSSLVERS